MDAVRLERFRRSAWVGDTPFAPHEDDGWFCETNLEGSTGDTALKSYPAIELNCDDAGWTSWPTFAPTAAPSLPPTTPPTSEPTYTAPALGDDIAIPNIFMSTQKRRVVAIDFDSNRYESIVEEDGNLDNEDGIIFIDQ